MFGGKASNIESLSFNWWNETCSGICLHRAQIYLIISYQRISGFPIGYEEVRSISNPPADVCLGGGFEIDVSAATIMKRFEQISDEDLNKK